MSPVPTSRRVVTTSSSNLILRILPAVAIFVMALLGLSEAAAAQTSCTGLCLQQVACTGGGTTSISGTVYAPNGTDPLPNVLVYIPNAPVTGFAAGVACNPNGTPVSGSPLVSTTTAVNGTFKLTNVPVGTNIPLVIQAGKWRRQFVIPATSSCSDTAASTSVQGQIRLPRTHVEGDIPLIAIATGAVDSVECVLNKMGVATSEFTNPGGGGRIQFYYGIQLPGAKINASTPPETALESNLSTLQQYDLVMLPCQGEPYDPGSTALANMVSYANGGGRIYATHYSYDFLTYTGSPFNTTASWDVAQTATIPDQTAFINLTFPDGAQLAQWLKVVDPSTTLGTIQVNTLRQDQDGINTATSQAYLSILNPSEVIQFTFSTPVGFAPANQCGRVLYNEYHVDSANDNTGLLFPAECPPGAITPQEQFLEYSLFDLGTFSSPPAVPTVSVAFVNPTATLTQGDSADSVTVNITNTSNTTATNTTLSFALTLPAGLTATALAPQNNASGWTCNVTTLTCNRGTGLNAGASDNVVVTFSVSSTATSPQTLNATVSNGNLAAPATAFVQLPVLFVPTITWPTPAPINYGTALSGTQLDATASYGGNPVAGTFVYSPAAGAVLNAGMQTLGATFTPAPSVASTYAGTTQIVGLQVNPAPQIITFTPVPTSPDIAGDTVVLSATGGASGNPVVFTVLSGPATLAHDGVTLTYTGAGTVVVAADQAGSDDGNYAAATEVTATIIVNPAVAAYASGTVPVASRSSVLTATLNFPNGGTLGSLSYLTQGAPNLDYIGCASGPQASDPGKTTKAGSPPPLALCALSKNKPGAGIPVCAVGTAYSAGQICTVSYVFQPTLPGLRLGGIAAIDNNGNAMGMSYLSGIGTGPEISFSPATLSVLPSPTPGTASPRHIVVDSSGNIFYTDTSSNTVKEVIAASGYTTTQVINSGLISPYSLALDGAGDLFIGDGQHGSITELTAASGYTAYQIIGHSTGIHHATALAVDPSGNLFAADTGSGIIVELTYASGYLVSTPVYSSMSASPADIAVDGSGNLIVATTPSSGPPATLAGVVELSAASNYASSTQLPALDSTPQAVALDGEGNVYVSSGSGLSELTLTPVNYAPARLLTGNVILAPGLTVFANGKVFLSDITNQQLVDFDALDAPSLAFAGTDVGLTSGPNTVIASNVGNDPTSINPLTFSGISTGTVNFGLDPTTNTCSTSTSLEPGQTCALAVDFTPQAPGSPLTDSVTLADNNLNNITSAVSTQSVPLSGNGLQQTPVVTVAPATFGYGFPTATFTASVSFTGTTAPTGAVYFNIDGGASIFGFCTGTTSPLSCTSGGSPTGTIGAGSHTITATIAASPGFLQASGSNTLTVTPAALTVTAGSYSGVYDGATHALSACTVSLNFDGITCTNNPVGPVGPDVGGATVTPVVSVSTANYTVTTNNGAWSITPLSVTVTAGSYSGIYDGSPHAPSTCTSSYMGVTCTNNPDSVGPGVGLTTVVPVASVVSGNTTDYTLVPQSGSGSITQASSITTVSCPASVVYNGAAQTPCTATVTGAGIPPQTTVPVTYSPNTNVTHVTASATFSGDANHTSSSNSTTFSITPASLTVTAGSYTGVYDGATHALSNCVVGSNPDGLTCTNSPAGPVGPDVAPATPVIPSVPNTNGNYTVTSVNGSWSITPKPVTLTAGSYSGSYDGNTHAPSLCTSTYGGVTCTNNPVSVGPGVVSGGVTNPVPSFPTGSSGDYTVTNVPGTYNITKLAASVTPNPASKVYGTADPVLTGTLSGFLSTDNVMATYTRTVGQTVTVSPYTISATLSPTSVLSNYSITYNTAPFTITPATPVITWATPAPIVYGTPLSPTQLDATANTSGVLNYTPAAGSTPAVGTDTLSVTFTPSDPVDYTTAMASTTISVTASGLRYVAVAPCRIADTRNANGAFGGPIIPANGKRTFLVPNSSCGIPATAQAYALNVTVVPPTGTDLYYLQVAPTGTPQPPTSLINSNDGRIKSVSTIIGAGTSGGVDFYATQATQVVVDITGYYTSAPTALEYYPVAPCRAVDTRTYVAGGPVPLTPMATENFVLAGKCNIPSTAQAYSVNVTGVPLQTKINQLTVWATGTAQPATPLLTSQTGIPVANGTIVKAGTNGSVSILSTDPASVVIDVNGYYAPAGTGGLSLYPVTPCRALDTRKSTGGGPFVGTKTVSIPSLGCGVPTSAKAFVLNATVQPVTVLDYLSLYPNQATVPNVSLLDAVDGYITANLAVVSTTNGSINAYATNTTHLVLDVNGYFAP